MELIEQLSKKDPLYDKSEYYSEWINVNDYKKFVLCFCGDVMLNLTIEWSCDTTELKQPMIKVLCASASGLYKYACERVKLPFVRLCLQNKTGMKNEKLDLNFFGVDKVEKKKVNFNEPTFSEPLPSVARAISDAPTESPRGLLFNQSEPEKHSRFRSPFKKATERKSSLSTPPKKCIPTKDLRLPEVPLPNSILIGQKGGVFTQLGCGMPDQVLKVGQNGPEWGFVYPTASMDTSQWDLK